MDNQKDKNLQESTLSANGQSLPMSQKNVDPISFFEKDELFVFVYKKTEKLMTALYMVTNLFSDHEPMKWTLRKKMSDLLSFILSFKDTPASAHLGFNHEVKSKVLEIVSLLEVSSRSGLVSSMNFSILKQEFINLISVLDSSESVNRQSSQDFLPSSFFDVQGERTNQSLRQSQRDVTPKQAVPENITVDRKPVSVKDNTTYALEPNVFKKNNRQNVIIQLLKKKKKLTIKDISQVIRDCSEKTIQRELMHLVEMGVISKTGKRRWTQYFMVSPEVS